MPPAPECGGADDPWRGVPVVVLSDKNLARSESH